MMYNLWVSDVMDFCMALKKEQQKKTCESYNNEKLRITNGKGINSSKVLLVQFFRTEHVTKVTKETIG